MTVSFQAKPDGLSGALQINGADVMRFGADNSGQLAGFRNLVINGDMRVKQQLDYVNTLTAATVQYCGADRWFVVSSISASLSVTRQNTSLQGSAFGLRVQRASGVTEATTLTVAQQIESNNLYQVQGKKVTLSFKARCGANFSPTNSRFLALLAFGTTSDQAAIGGVNGAWTGWSHVPVAFSAGTSWTYYTATFDVPASTQEIQVKFSWATVGTAGAEDWLQITDVQIEEGSIATPFERRPVGLELSLCQRYFEIVNLFVIGNASAANGLVGALQAYNTKLVAPTWTAISVLENINCASLSINNIGTSSARVYVTSTAAGNLYYTATYKLDAEL